MIKFLKFFVRLTVKSFLGYMQNLENIEVYWKPIMLYWTPIKVNIANIFTLFMRIRLKFANPLMYKFHSTSKEWIERTEKPKSIERTIEQLCGCSTNKEKQKLKIRRILYSGIFSLVSSPYSPLIPVTISLVFNFHLDYF